MVKRLRLSQLCSGGASLILALGGDHVQSRFIRAANMHCNCHYVVVGDAVAFTAFAVDVLRHAHHLPANDAHLGECRIGTARLIALNPTARWPRVERKFGRVQEVGMKRKFLRCYVIDHGDQWEAVCVDLDISVQGDSFDDAVGSLREGIEVFLESVMALPDAADRRRLLSRRLPFWRHLKLAWRARPKRRIAVARHDLLSDACPA